MICIGGGVGEVETREREEIRDGLGGQDESRQGRREGRGEGRGYGNSWGYGMV